MADAEEYELVPEDEDDVAQQYESYPWAAGDPDQCRRAWIFERAVNSEIAVDAQMQYLAAVEQWIKTGNIDQTAKPPKLKAVK